MLDVSTHSISEEEKTFLLLIGYNVKKLRYAGYTIWLNDTWPNQIGDAHTGPSWFSSEDAAWIYCRKHWKYCRKHFESDKDK